MTLDTTQAYGVLGLAPGATPDEVKTAYRDLVKVWHPDRFAGNERLREKAQRQLQLYNEAYERLRDLPAAVPAAVAMPSVVTPPDGLRRAQHAPHVKHSLFTGSMNAVRHSLKVLWPSATYLRKRRRRRLPAPAWIIFGLLALLFAAFGFAALVYEGLLDF
ncbi:MAG TPA: J domain-containing protein [Gemmatimonadales bacterium]|nr:J domain-containing protein [Gemmatimonadales bacterium]